MADDSDRLGKVLERAHRHLSRYRDSEIVDMPIAMRSKLIEEGTSRVTAVNDSSPLQTSDLDILARAFVNMNQEPEEIPPLTKQGISDIPNEEARSQLKEMRFVQHIQEQALKTAQANLDAQIEVNRQCMNIIANLTELLKQRG